VFDSLDVVRSVSTEIVVLNKARWMFHLSQIFTEGQKPFCEQGEHTNACKQTTDITERYSYISQNVTPIISWNALCYRL